MAKTWEEMSKEERLNAGGNKKSYNKATGQERYAEGGELADRAGYGGRIDADPGTSFTMDYVDSDTDGVDDRNQKMPGGRDLFAKRSQAKEKAQTYNTNASALNNEHSPKANDVGAQAKPAEYTYDFGLSNNPNADPDKVKEDYQAIYRNSRLMGGTGGKDPYSTAGLKNPNWVSEEWNQLGAEGFNQKYGATEEQRALKSGDENLWEVYHAAQEAQGMVRHGGGWSAPNTMDRATFNSNPDAYMQENPELFGSGYGNPNDEEFKKNFDYTTRTPVYRNAGAGMGPGGNIEQQLGASMEDLNKGYVPDSKIDFSQDMSTRQGWNDMYKFNQASKAAPEDRQSREYEQWSDYRSTIDSNEQGTYGQGFYEKLANKNQDYRDNMYDPHGHFTNFNPADYQKGGSKYSGMYSR